MEGPQIPQAWEQKYLRKMESPYYRASTVRIGFVLYLYGLGFREDYLKWILCPIAEASILHM